jgi:hypothetical protein
MGGPRWTACWLVLAGAAGWSAVVLWREGTPLLRTAVAGQPALADPAAVLTAVAELALCLLLARVAVCAASVSIALLLPRRRDGAEARGGVRRCDRLALALSPRLLRPVVAVSLSAGAALLGAGSAVAAPLATVSASTAAPDAHDVITVSDAGTSAAVKPLPDAGWQPTASSVAELPTPGWSPVRPPADARRPADVSLVTPGAQHLRDVPGRRGTSHRAMDRTADAVVVRRGDTLWSLAARQLGPDASDARVAAQWHRWWHANRTAIGSDPDLLLPGTVLLAPVEDVA